MISRRPWDKIGSIRHAGLEQRHAALEQRHAEVVQRVADLEAEVSEMRRHNMRLAELTDVVQELLVPMAGRDEERIRQAIAQFNASI